jgi:esterase/lipase superfamily enzyme
MREHAVELHSPDIGAAGTVVGYGHRGRPVLVFPSEQGRARDFANNGMVGAVADLIDAGRVRLYCVDSYDGSSWSAQNLPLEERARRHERYESWILHQVVPHIATDTGDASEIGTAGDVAAGSEIATAGCSMGAFHALNFAVKHADLFPLALCFSGSYDPASLHGWGERGDRAYFNNPSDYLVHLGGEHLDWLRSRLSVLLVCGQGQWEDTTGALASTRQIAAVLADKGIRHELDLWGHDVPHDWPSWRAQFAHHLPRFC